MDVSAVFITSVLLQFPQESLTHWSSNTYTKYEFLLCKMLYDTISAITKFEATTRI